MGDFESKFQSEFQYQDFNIKIHISEFQSRFRSEFLSEKQLSLHFFLNMGKERSLLKQCSGVLHNF